MATFVILCLLSRLFYALNDTLTGRLAREHDGLEIAALRGLTLGFTMAPILAWVPRSAWPRLASEGPTLALVVAATALANVLHLQAARALPFGIRASIVVTGVSLGSVLLGYVVLGERLPATAAICCTLIVLGAVLAAPGKHATHEIRPRLLKGALLAIVSGCLFAVVGLLMKGLAEHTHPLLAAWAWELGAGLILLPPLLLRRRIPRDLPRHLARVALYSSPTVIGSSASLLALGGGELGLWGALAGTQVLFAAALGVLWHREVMGLWRWVCFVVAALGVAGLTWSRG